MTEQARETPEPLTPEPSDRSPDYNRGWADGQASALDACQPVIDGLQAALRAATPDPAELGLDLTWAGWGWCDVQGSHSHSKPWTGHNGPHPHRLAPFPADWKPPAALSDTTEGQS
jgi:hypothetical protein